MTNQASAACFASLVASASVEISSRGHQLQELRNNFAPGKDVTITFLPGDNTATTLELRPRSAAPALIQFPILPRAKSPHAKRLTTFFRVCAVRPMPGASS
jgi:methylenetetrahydrofolate reductase (NADPH)